MPATRLALAASLALTGCVLYLGGDDEPVNPPPDAASPWDPIDAWSSSTEDAAPGTCSSGSNATCGTLGGPACFVYPPAMIVTPDDTAPNLACAPAAPGVTAAPVTVLGTLRDDRTGEEVSGQVEVFQQLGAQPIDVGEASVDGRWSVSLPAGVPTRLTVRTRGDDLVDVYDPQLWLDGSSPQTRDTLAVSTSFFGMIPAFTGVPHGAGTALIFVEVVDCDGAPIANAVVALAHQSGASGTCPDFVEWVRTFYSAPRVTLPVRRSEAFVTQSDGRAYLVELNPSGLEQTQYVQVWGYTDVVTGEIGAMSLLAEIPVKTFGESITRVVASPALP